MAWLDALGSYTSIRPSPSSSRLSLLHILAATLYLLTILLLITAFPLLILFTPKLELRSYVPRGLMCATCAEIAAQNPILLEYTNGGEGMGCVARVDIRNPSDMRNTTYSGMRRCWAREKNRDEWLRPIGWSREDIVKYTEAQQGE